MQKNNFLYILFLFLSLVSCDSKRVFDEYKHLSKEGWKKNQKIEFSFKIKDTISGHNLFINLRNNNDYPFSNLFLITEMKFPNGKQVIDTLAYEMTDAHGKFLGSGFTEIKENKLFYKEHVVFPEKGAYVFSVEQAMRKGGETDGVAALKGITDVGFRIEK